MSNTNENPTSQIEIEKVLDRLHSTKFGLNFSKYKAVPFRLSEGRISL